MGKKNEPKKLCWNCDGNISLQLVHCPYCKADLTQPKESWDKNAKNRNEVKENFAFKRKDPLDQEKKEVKIPKPPYATLSQEPSVSEDEWQKSLEKVESQETLSGAKKEMIALLLLLPGVVFFLFGILLALFSQNGVLTLKWSDSFAYFYLLGAIPLLILGWKYLK